MSGRWAVCCGVGVLLVGSLPVAAQTFSGTLAAGDPVRESGQFQDTFTFEATEGQEVTVSMRSDAFDGYLIVESPAGTRTENDDFAPNLSQVSLVADQAGAWTIYATAYSSGATGPYEVEVELGRIGRSTVLDGRLDPNDELALKGEHFDTHAMPLEPGAEHYVELVSHGFDGYLVVRDPSGQTWRNDDAGSTTLARVGPLPGAAGEWTIFVTSAFEGQTGAYDLKVTAFEAGSAPPVSAAPKGKTAQP
jgi:hypothetical protein